MARLVLIVCLVPCLGLAQVDDATARCTRRVSHLLGMSTRSNVTALAGATPQQKVREWLDTQQATRSFARFVNARFNPEPATNLSEDGVYAAVRFVLQGHKPWRELFTGRYLINHTNNLITEDATAPALGYFGSVGWQKRYLGNAPDGLMLRAAYRVMQNTIGIELRPSAVNFEGDATAVGRERPECRGCHFLSPYALDKAASLLPRKVGVGGGAKVQVVPVTPQVFLGDLEVRDFEHFLEVLTTGDPFAFRTCRLAFEFAYGRAESGCEAQVFDRCVDVFRQSGQMKDALASILEDPAWCEAVP